MNGLRPALNSENESWRIAARRALATLSDISISDDETAPNYASIHGPASLGYAERCVGFLQSLQLGRSNISGFSANIDATLNAIGQGNPPAEDFDDSSDNLMESASQRNRRYLDSEQCEVSDPGFWAVLHYGEGSESEAST